MVKGTRGPVDLVDIQKDNLQRAVDFLKFAEAKNAAAIASALILAIINLNGPLEKLGIFELLGVLFALAGAIASTQSFLPRLRYRKSSGDGVETEGNLLFFGEIGKMTEGDFHSNFTERYSNNENLLKDYSNQIVANSKVASEKMSAFALAVPLISVGIFLFLLDVAFELFQRF